MIYDCIIIGAGASGVFAALNLKSDKILLLDKNNGLKKLSITGRTRCNITNSLEFEEFLKAYGRNGRFLQDSFRLFFRGELLEFLKSIGIKTVNEIGKIRINNVNSMQFAKKLLSLLRKMKVEIHQFEPVAGISKNSLFEVKTDRALYMSKTVILSCGGISYPKTGSTGDGYRLARSFGHKITKLSAYESAFDADRDFSPIEGVSLENAKLKLKLKKSTKRITGDIIFTHSGISGPAVLKLSETDFDKALLVIELIGMNEAEFIRFIRGKNVKLINAVSEIIPKRLAHFIIKDDLFCKETSNKLLHELFNKLENFSIMVKKCHISRSFITKGGVSLKDINPKTLESKLIKGLFFAGEMLDIQGSIGGFNLQAAFSTGFLAAYSINISY